jgi:hypothetical protein
MNIILYIYFGLKSIRMLLFSNLINLEISFSLCVNTLGVSIRFLLREITSRSRKGVFWFAEVRSLARRKVFAVRIHS